MIFEDKQITLKDGSTAVFRSPRREDAEQLLSFIKQSCDETDFLTRYSEEWTISVEQEAAWIERQNSSDSIFGITCYIGTRIVGNCSLTFMGGIKTAHRATIGIAILKEFWGLGIGSAMFCEMLEAAKAHGTEIVELEYVDGNERGRRLYEKFGFKAVAKKPNVFKLKDGSYRDEVFMQKYLREI